MKCHDLHQTLIFYLDNEATPLEQKQIRDHLAGCAECQAEVVMLRKLQSHLRRSLKTEAAQVAPSQGAWRRLQSRLANEPVAPLSRGNGLLHRLSLLGSNYQGADRKNKPASDISQDWSWTSIPAIKQWWHQGLVWAAKWSVQSQVGKQSKKPLSIRNKQASESEDDKPG